MIETVVGVVLTSVLGASAFLAYRHYAAYSRLYRRGVAFLIAVPICAVVFSYFDFAMFAHGLEIRLETKAQLEPEAEGTSAQCDDHGNAVSIDEEDIKQLETKVTVYGLTALLSVVAIGLFSLLYYLPKLGIQPKEPPMTGVG